MLNKWPYYAQILLIKWLMYSVYYNLHFATADWNDKLSYTVIAQSLKQFTESQQ